MSTLYPSQFDGTAQLPNVSGTMSLDGTAGGADHALVTTNINTAAIAIENVLGTTGGTSVLSAFKAGQTALPIQAGTLGTTVTAGTFNNLTFGTPNIIGGTIAGSPVIQGTVINGTNIADAAVTERKIKMDQLTGTTLTTGTTASGALVGIVGGSVTINLNVASNVMIFFGAIVLSQSGVPLFSLFVDGTADSIWNDTNGPSGWNGGVNAFTTWRTGLAAGTHTWQMKWRASAGTMTIQSFELIVQPFSQ